MNMYCIHHNGSYSDKHHVYNCVVMDKTWASIQIVGECTLLACGLGIAMDLVTAHIAVEYFTVHHPKIIESQSPIAMAFLWGVGASWWFGAIAGIILAIINFRRPEPLSTKEIRTRMAKACLALWLTLMTILATCFMLISLMPASKRRVSFDFDRRIMSVTLTHMTEYVLGAIALIIVGYKLSRAQPNLVNNADTR